MESRSTQQKGAGKYIALPLLAVWLTPTVADAGQAEPTSAYLRYFTVQDDVRDGSELWACLFREHRVPDCMALGTGRQLEQALIASYQEMGLTRPSLDLRDTDSMEAYPSSRRQAEDPLAQMHDLLWAPLRSYMDGLSRVYVHTEPPFREVPFAALRRAPNGPYLVEELELVHVLGPSRPFEGLETVDWQPVLNAPNLVALGDVDYGGAFRRLASTKREVNQVVGTLKRLRGQVSAKVLTGSNATLEKLRKAVTRSSILHLSTHGGSTRSLSKTGEEHTKAEFGLALAGPAEQGRAHMLVADDVRALCLPKLELAVLAACRSFGEEQSPRSSLHRAFHQVGARMVVGSRWDVDTIQTQRMMVKFYESLLVQRRSPSEALRRTQLHVLRSGQADSANPRYWAAWVVSVYSNDVLAPSQHRAVTDGSTTEAVDLLARRRRQACLGNLRSVSARHGTAPM